MKSKQQILRKIDDYIRNIEKQDKNKKKAPLFNPTPEHYAAIYARISGNNDSFSIPSQIEACKRFIEKENMILYKIYQDKKSARQIHFYERDGFKKLLNDMEAGMFRNLVIIRRDRLSRRIDDFMQLRRIFKKHGVKVFYVKEGNLNFDSSSYITNFLENILMSISTLEPEYIYQRTKGGRQNLRYQGIFQCGKPPIGYERKKGEKHSYIIHDAQASLVKEIFDKYREFIIENNKSIDHLIAYINKFKENKKLEKPKVINSSFIEKILQRSIYGGKMIIEEDDSIDDCVIWDGNSEKYLLDEDKFIECKNFAPIINWNEWKEIFLHYYLVKNGPLSKEYLFKNLLFCNNCKSILILEGNYYRCPNNCIEEDINKVIEIVLKQIIHEIDSNPPTYICQLNIQKVNKKLNDYNRKLNLLRTDLKNKLDSYISSNIENENNNHAIKSTIEHLQKEISVIQDDINDLGSKKLKFTNILNNIDSFKIYLEDFCSSDINFFKENWKVYNHLISKFVSKVVYKKKNGQKSSCKIFYKK